MSTEISTQDFFNNQQSFFDQFSDEQPEAQQQKKRAPPPPKSSKRKDSSELDEEVGWNNNKALKLPPKKPGRKMDTSIPATKRKAQNRAAQRAFRERKERHVKDLEDRVTELENEAAATNHENEFLKQQVEKLQGELEKYKTLNPTRNSSASSESSNNTNNNSSSNNNSGNNNRPFTFEFPFFSDHNKQSPTGIPYPSPSSLHRQSSGSSSSASPFTTAKNTVSPYAADTPASSITEVKPIMPVEEEKEESSFCDQLSLACGNSNNPFPKAASEPKAAQASPARNTSNSAAGTNENTPNGQQNSLFSPPPFDFDFLGSYRDPLFDNSAADFNLPELSTTEYSVFDPLENPIVDSSFNSLVEKEEPAPVEIKKEEQDHEDDAEQQDTVPAPKSKFMSCSAVWDRVSSHPKFNDLDIDGLCSELRTKVKCSDSGILLTENDVEKVLSTLS